MCVCVFFFVVVVLLLLFFFHIKCKRILLNKEPRYSSVGEGAGLLIK